MLHNGHVYESDLHEFSADTSPLYSQHKKASNHHANLPLEMYSFTL